MAAVTPKIITTVSTIQIKNCVRATAATPRILPIISWKGLTEEIITSTILVVFSSITLLITILPNIKINIYIIKLAT